MAGLRRGEVLGRHCRKGREDRRNRGQPDQGLGRPRAPDRILLRPVAAQGTCRVGRRLGSRQACGRAAPGIPKAGRPRPEAPAGIAARRRLLGLRSRRSRRSFGHLEPHRRGRGRGPDSRGLDRLARRRPRLGQPASQARRAMAPRQSVRVRSLEPVSPDRICHQRLCHPGLEPAVPRRRPAVRARGVRAAVRRDGAQETLPRARLANYRSRGLCRLDDRRHRGRDAAGALLRLPRYRRVAGAERHPRADQRAFGSCQGLSRSGLLVSASAATRRSRLACPDGRLPRRRRPDAPVDSAGARDASRPVRPALAGRPQRIGGSTGHRDARPAPGRPGLRFQSGMALVGLESAVAPAHQQGVDRRIDASGSQCPSGKRVALFDCIDADRQRSDREPNGSQQPAAAVSRTRGSVSDALVGPARRRGSARVIGTASGHGGCYAFRGARRRRRAGTARLLDSRGNRVDRQHPARCLPVPDRHRARAVAVNRAPRRGQCQLLSAPRAHAGPVAER